MVRLYFRIMTTVNSSQPWQQRLLNQSGIRRLKIVDADLVTVLLGHYDGTLNAIIVPQEDVTFYEFIFPSDLSCVAGFQRLETESGSVYYTQALSFNLPHISNEISTWSMNTGQTRWLAFTEDYNGECRVWGGAHQGLKLDFSATTGESPRGANPMSFSLSEQQLLPYISIGSYEDNIIFPNNAGFSYGFSTGFNS